jgi:hypothetical protein
VNRLTPNFSCPALTPLGRRVLQHLRALRRRVPPGHLDVASDSLVSLTPLLVRCAFRLRPCRRPRPLRCGLLHPVAQRAHRHIVRLCRSADPELAHIPNRCPAVLGRVPLVAAPRPPFALACHLRLALACHLRPSSPRSPSPTPVSGISGLRKDGQCAASAPNTTPPTVATPPTNTQRWKPQSPGAEAAGHCCRHSVEQIVVMSTSSASRLAGT